MSLKKQFAWLLLSSCVAARSNFFLRAVNPSFLVQRWAGDGPQRQQFLSALAWAKVELLGCAAARAVAILDLEGLTRLFHRSTMLFGTSVMLERDSFQKKMSQTWSASCALGEPWGSEGLLWAKRDFLQAQP